MPSPIRRTLAQHSDGLAAALDFYRDPEQFLSDAKPEDFELFASLRHTVRVRNILAQYLVRQVSNLDPRIRYVLSDENWAEGLERLERKGYTLQDVKHWAWILIPDDPDKCVTRFFQKSQHQPLFILYHLLSAEPAFTSPDSLWALLQYCRRWYSTEYRVWKRNIGRSLSDETGQSTMDHLPSEQAPLDRTAHHVPKEKKNAVRHPSLMDLGMDPQLFGKLLSMLSTNANRLSSSALPAIADLAVSYIKQIGKERKRIDTGYKLQCEVFNVALQAVSSPAIRKSYDRSVHSWRAIATLLAFSSSLKGQPFIIERDSYRAIRQTLLLLPKTDSERDTASALGASWPAYRMLRDGMEEMAGTEEYVSRVVKAGYMMQEAGYAKDDIDVTTDILGGMAPDNSPTVQTRANYPYRLRVANAQWAALIRTTRNAQEAWMAFQRPPEPGTKPTFNVYWELLTKIAAKPAGPEHHNLPGDGREVFPYDDTNLTEFEKGRLTPPTARALIAEMFQSGVVLQGHRLPSLISKAYSMREALEYLDHSDLEPAAKECIKVCMMEFVEPPPWLATKHHQNVLRAFVKLLCDLQPNRTVEMAQRMPIKHFGRIHYAFRLVQTAWLPTRYKNRAPWELVLYALARPKVALSRGGLQENELEVLTMATEVIEMAETHAALNVEMVNEFGRTIWKVMASTVPILLAAQSASPENRNLMRMYASQNPAHQILERPSSHDDQRSWRQILTPVFKGPLSKSSRPLDAIIREAARHLKKAWRAVSTIGPASDPIPNLEITPTNINNYMRTLAYVGDYEEMLLLLYWTLREWVPASGSLTLLEQDRLARVFRLFRAFAEPMLGEDTVGPLREEIMELSRRESAGIIYWPADEEIENYIRSDKWGNHQNLRELLNVVTEMEAAAHGWIFDEEQGMEESGHVEPRTWRRGLEFGLRHTVIAWKTM
ncbi:prefoldin subunit [Colletotrichum karsti]|uniref:Prefoldin subunit n=1 Tax=Colletotrichum karsti TaxID=1095194 RepID=A0A9P6I0K4_9PEZI|nr:prefoldin subunit [Colletotrichum karsti]KAF9873577.1 prefoldin subunit [Colletotrichum karsti]